MERIKFGTDGWRGIIADQYTVANVARITHATAMWLLNKYESPEVIIGYDTRFLGRMFADVSAKVLAAKGIKVRLSDDFVTTPMVSLAVKEWEASLGIMITASHNNYRYNGFKLKGSYGGPLLMEDLKNIEDLISMDLLLDLDVLKWDHFIEQELIRYADLESLYVDYIQRNYNLELIQGNGRRIAFDAMFGSGQNAIRKILKDARFYHCEPDPTFNGVPPEPIEKNLQEIMAAMNKDRKIDVGLAIDGDGDRIALVNKGGSYIDSHHIILMIIHFLAGYRNQKGLIVTGYSSTSKVEILSQYYGLEVIRVPIGFKDITRRMLNDDVLVGGEESGGISVSGYLPERDGIWMALILLQFMAESGKTLDEIIDEIYRITQPFACQRRDITIPREKRSRIMDMCSSGSIESFGDMKVIRHEFLDGFKFFFSENEWVMIRPSGTEPLLRTYAEGPTREQAEKILDITYKTIMKV